MIKMKLYSLSPKTDTAIFFRNPATWVILKNIWDKNET